MLAEHGLRGSVGRRGTLYDNTKAESFIKTLKVEAVYMTDYQTYANIVAHLPSSSTRTTIRADCIQLWAIVALPTLRKITPANWSIPQP